PIVMVEDAMRILRHIKVRRAVPIIIANRNPHAVSAAGHTCVLCNVRECAVAVVVIKGVAEGSGWLIEIARPTVHKVYVHPAVVVIVEECAAGAYRFGQVHFRGLAAHMNPGYPAGRWRDLFERDEGILACWGA